MQMIQHTACAGLILIGALFMGIAAIGLLRMPDLFMRMSCTTKASTLGMGCLMMAVAIRFPSLEIVTRALAVTLFVFLTSPVAAHMIARAGYVSGVPLWSGTIADQLCNRYDRCTCTLGSCPLTDDDGGSGSREPVNGESIGRQPDDEVPGIT
jgi:multicomponent Na+:H+ antiporter subunit G